MRKRAPKVRRLPVLGVLLVPVLLGSCSAAGGSKSASSGRPQACTFVAKLDDIADTVARADVHDPVAFEKTLDTAVRDYVATVKTLRGVAPADLDAGLENVEADVQQHRFDSAATDRAPLDAYAARVCGRAVKTSTTTSVTAPVSGTTAPQSSSTPPSGG